MCESFSALSVSPCLRSTIVCKKDARSLLLAAWSRGRLVALAAGRSWPLVALAAGRFGRLAAACTERKDVVFNLPAPWR